MANSRLICSIFALCSVFAFSLGTEVDVPGLGRLQGTTTLTEWTQSKVYEFRAIPYAVSPSINGRFKYPKKFEPWLGIRDATKWGNGCPQPGMATTSLYGQFLSHDEETLQRRATGDLEDCLTLDVHTKKIGSSSDLKPVFVAIHGGSFLSGMSSSLKPGFLLDENDIVLVVPQYRLGPLGFLNFDKDEAPGNMGLMDLVMALEWVRDHISAFGGDPNKVTVGGNSAGGASASLLMLSQQARGLFHQIIPQSGPATAFWALDKVAGDGPSRALAFKAGCTGPTDILINCLRMKSVAEITGAYIAYAMEEYEKGELGMKNSMPVIQRNSGVSIRVVDKDPVLALEDGNFHDMPALVTIVKHEGIFDIDLAYQTFLKPNGFETNSTYLREDLLVDFLRLLGVDDHTKVLTDSLFNNYFVQSDVGNFTKMTPGLIDFMGTLSHKGPSFTQAHSHASKANTYILSFDYFGEHTTHDDTPNSVPIPGGITHSDELIYLYPREEKLNEADTRIAKLMVKIFGNFVISGNPSSTPLEGVPAWPPHSNSNGLKRHIMSIRNGEHKLISDYRETYTVARIEGLTGNSAPSPSSVALMSLIAAIMLAFFR